MTTQDFKAHEDAITSICLIDDPISFVTASKDKKVKIWSIKCNLLGEINTAPSINHINPNKENWKFHVDYEKLKEREIEEVIEIFEELGGTPIKFDESKLIETVQDNSSENIIKKQKKEVILPSKRRYKPLEEYKKLLKDNLDDRENNINIDDQYHQEIKDGIEKTLNPNLYNIGMVEMVRTLMNGKSGVKEEENNNKSNDKHLLDKATKNKISKINSVNKVDLRKLGESKTLVMGRDKLPPINYTNKDLYVNKDYIMKKSKEKTK